jgi:hypothetical protein
VREVIVWLWPSSASIEAIARPMPLEAPVTNATRRRAPSCEAMICPTSPSAMAID